MTVTAKWYLNAMKSAFNGEIDWTNDNIRCMLLNDSYTPSQDNDSYKDDVVDYEVTGTGYPLGGATLTTKTVTVTGGTNVIKWDADDVVFTTSTLTAYYAVLYDNQPTNTSNKPLLGYVDFGGAETSNAGSFTISWSSDGIFTITPS